MANPTLRSDTFTSVPGTGESTMTMGGTQAKIGILAALCMGAGYYAWFNASPLFGIAGAIIGLVLALIISFKPATAPVLAPIYALVEGGLLGTISRIFEATYHGIVEQAILATAAVFCATLGAYVTRIIRPTQKFVAIVTAATGGIMLFYLISFVLRLFGISSMGFAFSSPTSILISVVICGVAAANLIIDYAVIESGVESGAPKYMEWYAAFGLLVTVIWLYLEILRLLAKLQKRD